MAAVGQAEKDIIAEKILATFEGSFKYDKEIRIPINGMQIKITMTKAKDNVEISGSPLPAEVYSDDGFPKVDGRNDEMTPPWEEVNQPTAEELANVEKIKQALGL